MKNYLKPYTACTTVESEGHLLSGSDGKGGGHNGGLTPGGRKAPCPPNNPSIGQTKDSWGSVKVGTPSPAAKEDYFTNFED